MYNALRCGSIEDTTTALDVNVEEELTEGILYIKFSETSRGLSTAGTLPKAPGPRD